jgi:hypothetical protein
LALKTVALGIALTLVLSISIIAAANWWLNNTSSDNEFFVGVEFAYSDDANDVKALVDKVKDYTNLFVIGSIEITFNQTILNEACDYIVDSGLHLIVLFTDSDNKNYQYKTFPWMTEAKQRYGDMLVGIYRYDEPGGNQLDLGDSLLVEYETDYASMAANYTLSLGLIIDYYMDYIDTVITADYGLYWFDYKAGYSAVLTEFGWNHSRPLHIGLCRGAAEAHNRDWGAIITWEYTENQYIESPEELYDDMVLAYKNGAKYVVVFDYPKIGPYGILTEGHFDALEEFWSYIHKNPQEQGIIQGEAAYVLPKDYGFGFRYPEDKIWGLWEADDLSQKVWNDVNTLLDRYGSRLDIVYDEPEAIDSLKNRYDILFFWNEAIA